jgi:hypothetical protein
MPGVGEYVRDPSDQASRAPNATLFDDRGPVSDDDDDDNDDDVSLFSVGPNAIVLEVASPAAIERAVLLLKRQPQLAAALGSAGRRTVQEHFTLDLQMQGYDELYKSLL